MSKWTATKRNCSDQIAQLEDAVPDRMIFIKNIHSPLLLYSSFIILHLPHAVAFYYKGIVIAAYKLSLISSLSYNKSNITGDKTMKTIGFIGTGNMGSAMAKAAYRSTMPEKIYLSNRTRAKAEKLAEEISGTVLTNTEVTKKADWIFLGVKPQMLNTILKEIKEPLQKRSGRYVLISLLAGKRLSELEDCFGRVPIIRVAPNIPALVGSGITLFSANQYVTEQEKEDFIKLMTPSGIVEDVLESNMEYANGVM